MANELLQADAGALEAAGAEYLTCGTNVQDVMTRMRNQSNSLSGSFQGSAAQAFYSKVDVLVQHLQTLSDEVNVMGNDLKATAAKVRQLQAEAANLFNQVGS